MQDTQEREKILVNFVNQSLKAYNGLSACSAEDADALVQSLRDQDLLSAGEAKRLKEKFSTRLTKGELDDLSNSIDATIAQKFAESGIIHDRVLDYFAQRLGRLQDRLNLLT